jgi:hypothetical protein
LEHDGKYNSKTENVFSFPDSSPIQEYFSEKISSKTVISLLINKIFVDLDFEYLKKNKSSGSDRDF